MKVCTKKLLSFISFFASNKKLTIHRKTEFTLSFLFMLKSQQKVDIELSKICQAIKNLASVKRSLHASLKSFTNSRKCRRRFLDISCAKMFADDTNITVPGYTFAELEQATNTELNNLCSWLKANKLSLNIAKTDFMVISTRQKLLAENCSEINIQLDDHPICRVEHAKSLGLIIDDRLSWSNHVKELCRKISSAIGALRRIRSLISQSTAVQIY